MGRLASAGQGREMMFIAGIITGIALCGLCFVIGLAYEKQAREYLHGPT